MGNVKNNKIPLFNIDWGIKELQDGIKYKNLFGTHLIGPLLVRNPEILEHIIRKVCKQKGTKYLQVRNEYIYENKSYEIVLKELEARKLKSIQK